MLRLKKIKHTSVNVVGLTHKGRVRKNNEDSYLIITPNEKKDNKETVMLLADGMGGYNKGEVASKLAIESFKEFFYKDNQQKKLASKVFDAIQYANKQVFSAATTAPSHEGMGTTLAVLVIYQDYAVIGNVGDSRIYVFEDNNLVQISEEHTFVNEIGLSPEQARNHPDKNVITRSIGKKHQVQPYVNTVIVKDGCVFLLCSDGLTTHVKDRFIRKVLSGKETLKDKANILLQEALKNGGTDNISIILASPIKIKQTELTKNLNKINSKSKIFLRFLIVFFLIFLVYIFVKNFKPFSWPLFAPVDSVEDSKPVKNIFDTVAGANDKRENEQTDIYNSTAKDSVTNALKTQDSLSKE